MADPPRQAVELRSPPAGAADRGVPASRGVVRHLPVIPERYAVRGKDGQRYLECDEAPRLRAIIDLEMSVSRAEAGSLGERVILLDGAGSFGPLIDNDRKLYNLDHHTGCERLFTLSTCEQALLLVESGLELTEGDWTFYANEPDLDTVLALWCLLNHRRVRELRTEARDVLLPLLRLEGAIDANGPELARLCGLPSDVLEETQGRIDELLARERALKQTGSWGSKNVHAYTAEVLRAVDAIVYVREDFGDDTRIEEVVGHVAIEPRRVAVACRDRSGIYSVEQHLKARWGDQLGLIALENQPGVVTLRRVSSLAGPDLEPAYELLNRLDPAVDGRPIGKRWGGSPDIGGSPRPHGTELSAGEILEILERAYRLPRFGRRVRRTLTALTLGAAFLMLGPLVAWVLTPLALNAAPAGVAFAYRVALPAVLAILLASLATRVASRRRPWVFGWRTPAEGGGWWLAPLVLLGAAPLGLALSAHVGTDVAELVAVALAGIAGIAAIEIWFRGLVHGCFAVDYPMQRPGGPWLLSRAAVISALTYAVVVVVAIGPEAGSPIPPALGLSRIAVLGALGGLSFIAGLSLAVIRERSISLWPGVGLQALGVAAAAGGAVLLA